MKKTSNTKAFTVEAGLTSISTLNDGGLGLRFKTKELTPEEKIVIMNYHNGYGFLLFKENAISEEEIPKKDAEIQGKTHSQRLRAVIYVFWEQNGAKGNFTDFYESQMERVIDKIKAQLE